MVRPRSRYGNILCRGAGFVVRGFGPSAAMPILRISQRTRLRLIEKNGTTLRYLSTHSPTGTGQFLVRAAPNTSARRPYERERLNQRQLHSYRP
jgi:hypothetical protein